jgi:hypothetical protein
MNLHKSLYIVICIAVVLTAGLTACLKPVDQGINYDPAKSYASFLVLNNDVGKSSLDTMKKRSTGEGLEIGPIEYYSSGNKDFEPILKKLTVSKQVTVVWIIASLWDINPIKDSMSKIEYRGAYRYVPISDTEGAIKIQQ